VTPSFALAFVAGLLSFLSPCVLPLIPSYVGFLTGLTLEELEVRRGTALAHALWFVAGFSLIFIALGATASALGVLLLRSQVWIGRIGGVVVILFGLYLLGVLHPGLLMRERKVQLALTAYSVGLALPFVLTALALDRFLAWFQHFRPYLVWVERIAGILLIVLGLLLVTDRFTLIAGWLQGLTPESLKSRL